MKIQNCNLFLGRRFVCGDLEFEKTVLKITPKKGKGKGYLIPGLVDIHTHGRMGADFSDGTRDTLNLLSRAYAKCGVTSFLATTMSLPKENLLCAMREVRTHTHSGGAKCCGIHLEGPFLSEEKKGAHRKEFLSAPDLALFQRLQEEAGGKIRLVTVAPELEGAETLIRVASKSCIVSLGHTAADYETCMRAFEWGASHVTHLFNAMPPFLHRAPGLIGAAVEAKAYVELICDGFHVHPAAVKGAFLMFHKKLALISDSTRCSGLKEGEYSLGGSPVFLRGGRVCLADGTLAGSCISLLEGIQRAAEFGISLSEAVYAATRVPALSVGLDAGEIKVGKPADLVLLNDDLSLNEVYVNGLKV